MKNFKNTALLLAMVLSGAAFAAGNAMQGASGSPSRETAAVHQTVATVKSVNAEKGTVLLAHGPVKSLNWPAMTMSFLVEDKALLQQLAAGKKVDVQFVKRGSNYLITSLK